MAQKDFTPNRFVAPRAAGSRFRSAYEHPLPVRLCQLLNTVSLFVMAASGLRIFRAFPSFGAKVPQRDFLNGPASLTLGGGVGGGLQCELPFGCIYSSTSGSELRYRI